jgi:mRNA interferase MazF
MATPDRGDLVWITFTPQAGHEQAGRRPAVVLSPREYHQKTTFVIVCPITTTIKGYPFEVLLPAGLPIIGVVLSDQVKSLDRHVRDIEVVGKAPNAVMNEITAKLSALLFV